MLNKYVRNLNYSCFSDLQRAAKALYLTLKSGVTITFINHTLEIIDKNRGNFDLDLENELLTVRNIITSGISYDNKRLADKILTLGILIRNKSSS